MRTSNRRRRIIALVLLPILLAGAAAQAQQPAEKRPATAPSGWRVIWTGDPATQATISWNTRHEGERHSVFLDTEPLDTDRLDDARQVAAQRNGRYTAGSSDVGSLYYHHARLRELEPDTKYHFVVESDGHRSPPLHFRTAGVEPPFALLFGGDSRSDPETRREVNRLIARLIDEQKRLLAFAHGGDYIARGDNLDQWHQWMNDHELTVSAEGRVLPIIPARGNHDRGPLFNEVFDFPEDDRNYYALSFDSACRVITLNTETSAAGDQKTWLAGELKTARSTYDWVLVQYHRPAWPAVKSPGSAKQHWVPLFEKHDVDLVCEADGHTIKRTPPIRDGQADPTGVTYIGEGGLGVGQRTPKIEDRWWLQPPGKAGRGHHVHLLTVGPRQLEIRVLLLEGETFDRHTLKRRQ